MKKVFVQGFCIMALCCICGAGLQAEEAVGGKLPEAGPGKEQPVKPSGEKEVAYERDDHGDRDGDHHHEGGRRGGGCNSDHDEHGDHGDRGGHRGR